MFLFWLAFNICFLFVSRLFINLSLKDWIAFLFFSVLFAVTLFSYLLLYFSLTHWFLGLFLAAIFFQIISFFWLLYFAFIVLCFFRIRFMLETLFFVRLILPFFTIFATVLLFILIFFFLLIFGRFIFFCYLFFTFWLFFRLLFVLTMLSFVPSNLSPFNLTLMYGLVTPHNLDLILKLLTLYPSSCPFLPLIWDKNAFIDLLYTLFLFVHKNYIKIIHYYFKLPFRYEFNTKK